MRIPSAANVEIGKLENKMKNPSTSKTVNKMNEDVRAGNPTLGKYEQYYSIKCPI